MIKEYLTIREFEKKVAEILKWQPMIGTTVQDEINWKTHEIMKAASIPIDIQIDKVEVDEDNIEKNDSRFYGDRNSHNRE